VAQLYTNGLGDDRLSLATKYGVIAGLGELGTEVYVVRIITVSMRLYSSVRN
jgi:hypothetical protein